MTERFVGAAELDEARAATTVSLLSVVTHNVPSFWRRVGVKDPQQFQKDDVVWFPRTGEAAFVKKVGTRLELRRGFGSQPAALRKGDEIIVTGTLP